MSVASAEFVVAMLAFTATFFHISSAWARRCAFSFAAIAFLYTQSLTPISLLALCVFLLSGYLVAVTLRRRPDKRIFIAYIVAMLVAFVVIKKYEVLRFILPGNLLDHPIAIVGLSYMLFRQIHFLTDVLQGQIRVFSLASYFNYQLNPLTLLSGPIQRFPEFAGFWNGPRPLIAGPHELMAVFQRIMLGVIKVTAIAAFCSWYSGAGKDNLWSAIESGTHVTRFAAARDFAKMFYFYPAYIYFNFSGYCDIVIGAGLLIGMKIPENFNHPYIARNMIDFWTRQHISLSVWIRDYVFMPMYKAGAERWPSLATPLVFICYFVAMFLAGIWHGSTLNWVVYGLLHGAGVSMTKIWEVFLIKNYGRPGLRRYMNSRAVKGCAIFLTLHFVCFAFLFFTPDIGKTVTILRTVIRSAAFN
jgi:alginate O-acetyltransferase complex protein AlgI